MGGGSNPIFAHGKMYVFPFFPMGKNGKKSIWKEREKYSFPSLSIYFFPIFPHGKKWENTHFSIGKNGVGPPPPNISKSVPFSINAIPNSVILSHRGMWIKGFLNA